jgi:DNA-directed RNA polymerase specialized sigma subunit
VHRQEAPEENLPWINASEYPAQLSEADRDILAVIKRDGASQMTEIAEASGVSYEHVRRRLWAMMADGVVGRWHDGRWDFPEHVELSARGRWPDRSDRAGKLGAHEVMRRMREHGLDEERISDIVGLHWRSVRTAIDHAEALDVPLDDREGTKTETSDTEDTTLDDHVEEADETEDLESADTDDELRPVIDDLRSVVTTLEEVVE